MRENSGSKEKILQCALALFSAKGYASASVQELVDMAGITKPTLYYYFGNKEGVYEQLSQTYYDMLDRALSTVAYHPNPKLYFEDLYPVLVNLTIKYFEFAKTNELFFRMALANVFLPPSSQVYGIVRKYHFNQYDIVVRLFKSVSGIHKNMLGKEMMLSWTYIGMVNALIGAYLNQADGADLSEENARQLTRQFMHGIFS